MQADLEDRIRQRALDAAPPPPRPSAPMPPPPIARRVELPAMPAARRHTPLSLGVALLILSLAAWTRDSLYTLTGVVSAAQWLIGVVGLPVALTTPVGWWRLSFIPLGLYYSRVQVHRAPLHIQRNAGRWHVQAAPLGDWIGWLFVVASNVATTYLGVRAETGAGWGILAPAMSQIAVSAWATAVFAVLLTTLPDIGIVVGWRIVRDAVRRGYERRDSGRRL